MNPIVFDGQQTDERILAELRPDSTPVTIRTILILLALVFFYIVFYSITQLIPQISNSVIFISTILLLLLLIGIVGWAVFAYHNTITYLTDRRIMRFEPISPVFTSKRALFWLEALKAKTFQTNMFWRMLKIGHLEVESQAQSNESVRVTDLFLYEDVANYIDKIIFTVKSKPNEVHQLRSFIPKPKGKRD